MVPPFVNFQLHILLERLRALITPYGNRARRRGGLRVVLGLLCKVLLGVHLVRSCLVELFQMGGNIVGVHQHFRPTEAAGMMHQLHDFRPWTAEKLAILRDVHPVSRPQMFRHFR